MCVLNENDPVELGAAHFLVRTLVRLVPRVRLCVPGERAVQALLLGLADRLGLAAIQNGTPRQLEVRHLRPGVHLGFLRQLRALLVPRLDPHELRRDRSSNTFRRLRGRGRGVPVVLCTILRSRADCVIVLITVRVLVRILLRDLELDHALRAELDRVDDDAHENHDGELNDVGEDEGDEVGGAQGHHVLDCLQRGGRYTCSGAIAGPMVELDLRTLYLRDLTFTGSTVIDLDVMPRLVSYIEAGVIKPLLAATYPLAELHQAQTAFIAKKHIGNIG